MTSRERVRPGTAANPSNGASPRHRFTVVDLFSGPGGTAIGFRRAGYDILAAIELNESAATTYERNLRVSVQRKDIRDASPRTLRRRLRLRKGELDVLVGCPPCQGFTRLRNREGAGDPRNSLVLRYLDFVTEFSPKYAVFENVPGLTHTRHGKYFYRKLTKGLAAMEYTCAKYELDAVDFGVAQWRTRVIVIAARVGAPPALIRGTHAPPKSTEVIKGSKRPWRTVRDVIGNGRLPPVQVGARTPRDPNHTPANTGEAVIAFLRRVPKNGGSRKDVRRDYWLPCHENHNGHYDTYGRMAWNQPANTITSGCTNPSKGRFVHPTQARALTIREAALLQGFPRRYRFYGTFQAEQVGNAVPPPLAAAIARSIAKQLRAIDGSPP